MGVVKGGPRPKKIKKKPPARIIFWLKKPEKLRIFFSWPNPSSIYFIDLVMSLACIAIIL